jgi:hypothetical protein
VGVRAFASVSVCVCVCVCVYVINSIPIRKKRRVVAEYISRTTRSVRKVSGLISFCKNLVDFNEVHLHEVTLNLHTHV